MKKILFVIAFSSFLFACNTSSNKTGTSDTTSGEAGESSLLTLNNGAKWKSDSNTNRHLVSLKTTANMFKVNPFPPIEEYHLLGSDLKSGIDSMIKDCKLTGAPHEELHKWLGPVLRQTNELKTITDTAVARSVFDSLDSRINIYYNYFE